MNTILISFNRTIKEYTRDRMIIITTLGVPLFFMILFPMTIFDVPKEYLPQMKGFISLTMATLLIMTASQSNLVGFIVADRERGLYRKIVSLPINLWEECLGRIVAVWIFSFFCLGFLGLISIMNGAFFNFGIFEIIMSLGFLFLIELSTIGTGLIIASFIKSESVATHFGVALSLLIFFLGGMAIPYSNLPQFIQLFAQIHPVSSATASIINILIEAEFFGYNSLHFNQILFTTLLSVIIFLIGILIYSKHSYEDKT